MSLDKVTDSFATSAEPGVLQQEKLNLSGMRCAACAQLIEYRMGQLPGVRAFTINYASHRADIAWDASKISIQRIVSAILDLGYGALPAGLSHEAFEQRQNRLELWRLFVAGFAMMQVMMYAFPAYLVPVPQADGDLTPDLDRLLKLASLIITLPVVIFSAAPFFRSAWRDLSNRHIGMDVPVSIGVCLSFLASVWASFSGGAVYFDSVVMFVFFLLSARFVEARVHRRTIAAVKVLTQLTELSAQRLQAYPLSRHTETVSARQIMVGDVLLVAAGQSIPADGMVLEGHSDCDEALMTGESRPVGKSPGSAVMAGAINLNAVLVMQAEKVGQDTQLAEMIGMMEQAAMEKPPLVALANKHASRFMGAILLIALLAGVIWYFIDPSRALWIAISVIVVTCPCALSLATPGVMAATIGLLAKRGILVSRGKSIEALAKVTHFVFDKTGTLTLGQLRLVETLELGVATDTHRLTLALAMNSVHPVSKAIVLSLREQLGDSQLEFQCVSEVPGAGLEGICEGRRYRFGRLDFVTGLSGIPEQIPKTMHGKTLLALGSEDRCLVIYALEDVLRQDAVEAIACLRNKGKTVLLLSGDRNDVVSAVAQQCGIAAAYGSMSPADKFEMVKKLQAKGAVVAMVGDGMNDGPVLSLSDVAVAMGQGAPIAQARGDLLLLSNRLLDLDFAHFVASKAFRLIRENLAWAVLYNLFAVPAAVAGLLEPWHAALGMSLSSVIVVANAMRMFLNAPRDHRLNIREI